MKHYTIIILLLVMTVFSVQAHAIPIGTTDRVQWITAAGGAPDLFFHFDQSSTGDNTVAQGTSVNALVDFYADQGIEFLPFLGTEIFPIILRNQSYQMSNSTGVDGHDAGRERDALLGNHSSPNVTSNLEGRAIIFNFLVPVNSFGVRVNNGDGGIVNAYDVNDQLIISQALPNGGFAGIFSGDVLIDRISIVNTFDWDIQFGLYDFQYHTVDEEPSVDEEPCDLAPVLKELEGIKSKLDAIPPERGTDGASKHTPADVDAVIEDEEINKKFDALLTEIEALKGIIQQISADMSEIKTKLNTGEVITQKDLAPGQGGVYFMGAKKMPKPDEPKKHDKP